MLYIFYLSTDTLFFLQTHFIPHAEKKYIENENNSRKPRFIATETIFYFIWIFSNIY